MIKANFNTYSSYVTDSLYQWDINQVLNVTGLNLAVVPEVHFSNANMAKAIVRQATKEKNVISVKVPNSLLQDPLTIYAHIGIYEGDTFKVVELVEIPVIPRKRPYDYKFEDTEGEIYSFNELENRIHNIITNEEHIYAHVSKWLEENPEATTTVQDGSLTQEKFSNRLKLYAIKDYVTPQMFGASGDGITDDTEVINTCLRNGNRIYFPPGTYVVNVSTSILPQSNQVIILDDNAIIKCNKQETEADCGVIRIIEKENVIIRGGKVEGDRYNRVSASYNSGSCIGIISSTNVLIENMELYNAYLDCIEIKSIDESEGYCYDVTIKNCKLHDSRRSGISVINCEGFKLLDCEIYNFDATIKPGCAIDFEPSYENIINKNLVVDNLYSHDTVLGVVVSKSNDDITIVNSNVDRIQLNNIGNSIVKNTLIEGELTCSNNAEADIENIICNGVTVGGNITRFKTINSVLKGFSNKATITATTDGSNLEFINCLIETGSHDTKDYVSGLMYCTYSTNKVLFDRCTLIITNPNAMRVTANEIRFTNNTFIMNYANEESTNAELLIVTGEDLDDDICIFVNNVINIIKTNVYGNILTFAIRNAKIIGNTIINQVEAKQYPILANNDVCSGIYDYFNNCFRDYELLTVSNSKATVTKFNNILSGTT